MNTVDFLSKEGVARIWQAVKDYAISNELLAQPSGVATLDEFGKVLQTQLPDYILGQVLFGGTIDGNGVATLTTLFRHRYNLSVATLDVDNLTAANYEGSYFIATANGVSGIAKTLDIVVGDWVISNGSEWTKIDNTDAVRTVLGLKGDIQAPDLRNAMLGKSGNQGTNLALGDIWMGNGDGTVVTHKTSVFARSILDGIASQSVFSGLYADKAKTLLNKRTIWGQEFDGSGNVSGGLSGVTTITASGNIATGNEEKTGSIKISLTTATGQVGLYASTNIGLYNFTASKWMLGSDNTNTWLSLGNVGIGTNSPEYKLHVNGTLGVVGVATHNDHILLVNSKSIVGQLQDKTNISLLGVSNTDTVLVGYGAVGKYNTNIYGKTVNIVTKEGETSAQFDENKNLKVFGYISGLKGVSAKGIADFGVGGSSGGNGGAHYDLLIDQKNDRVTLQLKGDDGDIDTKDMLAFSTTRAGIIPKAPSAGSVLRGNGWGTLAFSELASKPTTLGGYGVTDAYTKTQIENGIFPNMRVGLADDLGDIEETLDEEYTFQPTANPNEIRDGYAQIESLKGNSLVWNQLVRSKLYSSYGNITYGDDYNTYTITDIGANDWNNKIECEANTIAGHKYLFHSTINASKTLSIIHWLVESDNNNQAIYHNAFTGTQVMSSIITARSSFNSLNQYQLSFRLSNSTYNVGDSIQFKHKVYDLTQMFGEGYEPTTVEEFERRCPKGMPMDYTEGNVIHFNGDIKSVGFNQWDEEWEVGAYSSMNGNVMDMSNRIRCKNAIRVLPNATYYIICRYNAINTLYFYDESDKYLGFSLQQTINNGVFTTPSTAAYMRFNTASGYGETYNHDICINLSDPDKNGTYEPYTEFRRDLPTELFEGGMKGRGTAYDEVYWDKAKRTNVKVQRFGKVDLGTLDWAYGAYIGVNPFLFAKVPNLKNSEDYNIKANGVSDNFIATTVNNVVNRMDDKIFAYHTTQNVLFIYDSAYTNAAAFKAAMSGVMLYYELAEPIVEEIDIPYMDYQVSNSGTEEIVSEVPTTPVKARVTYNFDTVGTVRQNRFDISTIRSEGVAKLKTPRTIWGQSFDGSGNVSGDLHLNANAIYWHRDKANYCIESVAHTASSPHLKIAHFGGIEFNTASQTKMTIKYDGNVGIGTTDPQYKLDVNGSFRATSGEIDSAKANPLKINSTHVNTVELILSHESSNKLGLGWDANNGVFLYSYVTNKFLGIKDNGTPYFYDNGSKNLLHAGNTKLTLDPAYNWEDKNSQTNKKVYGFTLNVNGTEIGMSAITKEELEEMLR